MNRIGVVYYGQIFIWSTHREWSKQDLANVMKWDIDKMSNIYPVVSSINNFQLPYLTEEGVF